MLASVRSWAERHTGLLLLFVAAMVYLVGGPWIGAGDSFAPLADAFLHGRLYVTEAMPSLEMVPRPGGGWYSPFPPVPAIAMVPFVSVLGTTLVDTNWTTAIVGGIAVVLMWGILRRVSLEPRVALWLALAFAFGSELLWVAASGGQHHLPQVLALCLALGALRLALDRRHPLVAGLLLGLAAGSRLPAALATPLLLALYGGLAGGDRVERSRAVRDGAWFLAGLALPLTGLALYNIARFGSPFEFGYGMIVNPEGQSVLAEPWYSDGIESITYLPRNLYAMLVRSFDFVDQPPWLRPNWMGTSILITMPVLLYLVRARLRDPLVAWCLLAAGLTILPDLLHGAVGFSQFGYRFILDALPYLWLALALTIRDRFDRVARAALLLGVGVNLYGLIAVWGLGFVSY